MIAKLKGVRRFFFDGAIVTPAAVRDTLVEGHPAVFQPIDLDGENTIACGWVSPETGAPVGVLADSIGGRTIVAFRVDTLRLHAGAVAYEVDVERRALMASLKVDTLNRYQIAEIKESVVQDMRRKTLPAKTFHLVVLDHDAGVAYVGATSPKPVGLIHEALETTLGQAFRPDCFYTRAGLLLPMAEGALDLLCGLEPVRAGLFGSDVQADFELDDRPYAGGDFLDRMSRCEHLGALFLAWLWRETDCKALPVEWECWFDDSMVMDSDSMSAQRDTFAGGHPASSVEARTALRLGKLPQSARISLVRGPCTWGVTLRARGMLCDRLFLPPLLAAEEAERLDEYVDHVATMNHMLDELVRAFIDWRMSYGASGVRELVAWARNFRADAA